MPIVTISRQSGAGGHILGQALAKRLGFRLIDREIINKIAEKANVSPESVELAEKEAGNILARLINEVLSQAFASRQVKESWMDLTEEKYVSFVKRVIPEMAAAENLVIVGRGGQVILPSRPDVVKVLLVADQEDRIRFLTENYSLDREEAEKVVRREEKHRIAYIEALGAENPDDPSLYTVVFNTSHVSLKDAEDFIVDLVQRRAKA